ncbi:hypothetical protein NDU88_005854 [Pleurodeles waltl]|uniref:Uncharacterized protein n=1 Tax=Pleurodeles waltl TaxID=8319 RepID=A0AAV7TV51_PLEWA|nr:hypothetical protein NDU88_005854 [Pleurodeles waltl]
MFGGTGHACRCFILCVDVADPRPKAQEAGTRVIDSAVALAKRKTALQWTAKRSTVITAWVRNVTIWARAEERKLIRVNARGMRRHPLVGLGTEVLDAWEHQGEDPETDTDGHVLQPCDNEGE